MLKKIIVFLTVSLISVSCTLAASKKPAAIIATVSINAEECYLYPDIVIGEDGVWRVGENNDLFNKQIFTIFKGPKNEKLSSVVSIENNNGELPLLISNQGKLKSGFRYWAYYTNNKPFKNKGIDEIIVPKQIKQNIVSELQKNNTKQTIKKATNNDLVNIGHDFKMKINGNILQYSKGDLNGDNIQDYIIALGKGYGLPGEGIVVVVYISDKNTFKRLSVKSWKNNSDYVSGPDSFILKDVNGDKAEELFIIASDSDCSYPLVYSWFNNGLQKVYAGKTELWGGI